MAFRISAALILLLSLLFFPFWISVLLGLAEIFYFRKFYEAVALFLLSDLLYGVKENRFWGITLVSFIVSLVCILGIELLKRRLKFYTDYDR